MLLVVLLGALYFAQQRMVAARASISPTMSAGQQKLMQYLPVFFAIFQIFFLAALVVYYVFQTIFRILQQAYITRTFYGHDESLGRQAQRAGDAAREEAKKNPDGGGGFFAQAKRDLAGPAADTKGAGNAKNSNAKKPAAKDAPATKAGTDEQAGDASQEPSDPVLGGEGSSDSHTPRGASQQDQVEEVVEVHATELVEEILLTVGRMGARSPCSRKRTSTWSGSKPPQRPSKPPVKRLWINSASEPTRPSST